MTNKRPISESPDRTIVDFLRRKQQATIAELVDLLGVTATAVRQRLTRLMEQGLVERTSEAAGRGRPVHRYSLTSAGVRSAANNYDLLAQVLWDEVRAIEDASVRRGLLQRLAHRLAAVYRGQMTGDSIDGRMDSLATLMAEQDLPFELDRSGGQAALTVLACPYPELAERDRSVCAMEKMMISEALGETVRLSACRLDGDSCCTFEPSAAPVGA